MKKRDTPCSDALNFVIVLKNGSSLMQEGYWRSGAIGRVGWIITLKPAGKIMWVGVKIPEAVVLRV